MSLKNKTKFVVKKVRKINSHVFLPCIHEPPLWCCSRIAPAFWKCDPASTYFFLLHFFLKSMKSLSLLSSPSNLNLALLYLSSPNI